MTDFTLKKQLVENGKSQVFNNWNKLFGISKDEFIKNLEWLCNDPQNGKSATTFKNDALTREIAIEANNEAMKRAEFMAMDEKARKMFGENFDESKCEAHIVKLTRKFNKLDATEYYNIETGKQFSTTNFIAISARDRI